MEKTDRTHFDLAIVGGGVVGLWCAYFARQAGINVALFEANKIASGPSGGLLGALMPHLPTRWYEKKQFQFQALIDLEKLCAQIEDESGIDCGYRRVGRVLPLSHEQHVVAAVQQIEAAEFRWGSVNPEYDMRLEKQPTHENWPHESVMPNGATVDNFSARISPRGLTSALHKVIASQVSIFEDTKVEMTADKKLTLPDGSTITADNIIVTAGFGTFDLLKHFAPGISGRAVKGQAAILDTDLDPNLPVVHKAGVYLIVHNDGRTAVGSTSEKEFEDGQTTDHLLDEVIEQARAICPLVGDASVVERWANLRMQVSGRDPIVGPVPEHENIHVCTGGFKISFGIAHRMAQAALAPILGTDPIDIPPTFQIKNRVN